MEMSARQAISSEGGEDFTFESGIQPYVLGTQVFNISLYKQLMLVGFRVEVSVAQQYLIVVIEG